jgi:hypothetical protein
MAGEYQQDTGGGTLHSVIGTQAAWIAYNRARQYSLAMRGGAIMRPAADASSGSRFLYGLRQWFGYTATEEEMRGWVSGTGRLNNNRWIGGRLGNLTTMVGNPIVGGNIALNPAKYAAKNVFRGMEERATARWGVDVVKGAMTNEKLGVWAAESMLKSGESIATVGAKGFYNRMLYGLLGGAGIVEKKGAQAILTKTAKEGVELLAEKAGARLALSGTAHAAAYATAAFNPIAWGLIAWDIANYSELAFSGLFKTGEMIHYKIPKAYFQKSAKNYFRGRFEGIGPSAVLAGDNMNNRARAVQAIQGSKLNARSALGNEAGLLAGHFG